MTMRCAIADAWETYDDDRRFAGIVYGTHRVRMAVIGLGANELLVVSPGVPVSDADMQRLSRWGTPTFLLAPNHFHNAGLAWWKNAFPAARIVAGPRAQPRLQRRLPGMSIQDIATMAEALPEGIRVFGPPMAKQGETWISLLTGGGVAWFVADAIVNEPRLPVGALGLVMRILGFRSGLIANPAFGRFFVSNKPSYRKWLLDELDRDRPSLFVPSHGEPIRGAGVYGRLRSIAAALGPSGETF